MGEGGHTPVRVVTVNTWKGDGPYAARVEVLREQLAALDADVIALQEALVAIDGSLSTAGRLASNGGAYLVTHRTRRKVRRVEGVEVDSWSALAVISRWPIVEFAQLALPADDEDGERAVLFAAIGTPSGTLRVANTHLTHLRGRSDLRRGQLEAILAHPFLAQPSKARVLCGDMNATPGTPEIDWLLRRTSDWHVVDAYDAASGPLLRATLSERNPYVRAGTGERVIDYVFSLAPHERAQPTFCDARVVLDEPEAGLYPSDHFGVAVTIEVEG